MPKVLSSSADVITRVEWRFSWKMKMPVKPFGFSTTAKSAVENRLFLGIAGISKTGNDL